VYPARVRDTEERLRELEHQVDELSGDLRVLRTLVEQDHASALNKIRYVTEKVLHGLCTKHEVSWGTKEPTLENMIGPLIAAKIIPKNVAVHVRTVQTNASPGSHFQEDALSATHVQVAQIALLELLEWYYRGGDDEPNASSSMPAQTGAGKASSLPRARLRRRGPPVVLIGAGVVLIAGAAVYLFAVRGHGGGDRTAAPAPTPTAPPPPATPALHPPRAALAAIDRYEHPVGEGSELASETLWQAAADDFAGLSGQAGAPARWSAGEPFCRAQLALLRGELDGAVDALKQAIAADPEWAAPHASMAVALSRKNEVDQAIVAAGDAQRLDPESWLWVASGARVYSSANQLDKAIQEYRRALTMAPKEPILLAEAALVYHAAHLDGEAVRRANEALAIAPDMVGPRVMLAERALERRDGKAALEEAQRAVAASPRSVSALLAMGDAFALLGKKAEALEAYGKAIAAHDTVKSKGAPEARLEAARTAVVTGKLPPQRHADQRSRKMSAPDRSTSTDDPLGGLDL